MNSKRTWLNLDVLSQLSCFAGRFFVFFVLIHISTVSVSNTAAELRHSTRLEHIIVTAERRETDLQRTPVSVTAFTDKDIQSIGITEVPQLALRTPGLTIGNNGNMSFPEIYMRGVGTRDVSVGTDLSVGFYVDDVYMGRSSSMFVDLFDLERIEVLKGPQGTLWGRNTIGGAIHIVTAKPEDKFVTSHKFRIGNFDLLQVSGTVSGPVIEDQLLARFSYNVRDREGYSDNIFNGGKVGDAENISIRGSLNYIPADEFDFLLSFDVSKDRPTANVSKPTITGDPLLFGVLGNITVLDPPFNHVEPRAALDVNHNESTREHRDISGVSGKMTWKAQDFSVISLTAYRSFELDLLENTDGISAQLINLVQEMEQEQFSQELRVQSSRSDNLKWMLGGYFFHETVDDQLSVVSQDLALLLGPGDYSATNFSDVTTNSYSIFGQVEYSVVERVNASFEFRYTYEEKNFEARRVTNDISGVLEAGFALAVFDEDWKAFTPKVVLEFQQTEDVMYYFSASRGFRSGGYNSLQTHLQESFDPEFLNAYELGVKSTWFDRTLRVNMAAFYYDHRDLQVQTVVASGGGSIQVDTANAAKSRDIGFELELLANPVNGLHIDANLSYLDAEYKSFINSDGIDVSGNTINHAPEFKTNLGFQYVHTLGNSGSISLRGEHQYQSRIFFTETNNDLLGQKGYHNVNARLTYKTLNEKLKLTAFVNNLTNKKSAQTGVDLLGVLGLVTRIFNPPRHYGVEISLSY